MPLRVAAIADASGVSAGELRELSGERGGVARLLEARGLSAEDVVTKLLGIVRQRLDVDSGERADRRLSDLKRRLLEDLGGRTQRVEPTRRAVDTAAPTAALGFIPFDVQSVARVLGIAPQRLRELLRERTVAEIAERTNVPLRSIVDALMAPLEKRSQAAAADGTPTARLRDHHGLPVCAPSERMAVIARSYAGEPEGVSSGTRPRRGNRRGGGAYRAREA